MNRGVSLRLAAVAGLAAGGLVSALAGDLPLVASVTGDTVGLGLLAAGLAAAAAAETADGDRRATLLLAVAGGCLLLTTRAAGAARYGTATLAVVAGAGALYRSLVAAGGVETAPE